MRILLVSNPDTFCKETRARLEDAREVTAVCESAGGPGVMDLIHQFRPDLILLDLEAIPAEPPLLVAGICKLYPDCKVVVLSDSGRDELVIDALRQGARGHLVKGASDPEAIVRAVNAVSRGNSILSPALAGAILDELVYRYRLVQGARPAASG